MLWPWSSPAEMWVAIGIGIALGTVVGLYVSGWLKDRWF